MLSIWKIKSILIERERGLILMHCVKGVQFLTRETSVFEHYSCSDGQIRNSNTFYTFLEVLKVGATIKRIFPFAELFCNNGAPFN